MDILADLAEPILRVLAAVTMTVAMVMLGRAYPPGHPLGRYAVVILGIAALWRWLLVGVRFDPATWAWINPWIQVVNPAVFTLLAVLLALIGYAGRRRE